LTYIYIYDIIYIKGGDNMETKMFKISSELNRKLKIKCAENNVTIKNYITELIENDLK